MSKAKQAAIEAYWKSKEKVAKRSARAIKRIEADITRRAVNAAMEGYTGFDREFSNYDFFQLNDARIELENYDTAAIGLGFTTTVVESRRGGTITVRWPVGSLPPESLNTELPVAKLLKRKWWRFW